MAISKKLETIYHNGQPDGVRSIRRNLSTMTVYVVPRPLLTEAKTISGINRPGIYYLINESDDSLLLISGDDYDTFEWCITLYCNECRNYSFHKNIIDDWNKVETIRKNTFFMYVLLLGSCKLEGPQANIDDAFDVIDDRLEQLSLYIDDWKISDFFYQSEKEKQAHVFAIQDTRFTEYDDYGLIKSNELQFRSVDESVVLTIRRDNFPDDIWYLDGKNQKHKIPFIRTVE